MLNTLVRGQEHLDPTRDTHFLVLHRMTTLAAFNCIADLLKLACADGTGFSIRSLPSTLPPAIAPTVHQQIVPHQPYIDMLPWASLRDRVLKSSMVSDELDLLRDLEGLEVWGLTPWDPMGWEVGPEFVTKWWFLIDDQILRATNFWRRQRGEEALVLATS